ncbi:MAG: hypothetical protein U9Q70_08495 [Chloroflexota bacterium]|nr:hypothetical protein [Chloroflexota bacterium]
MGWLEKLARDPVPWLLDPVNPSARLLTLRDIFQRPAEELARERKALRAWDPVQQLLMEADVDNFWGRATNPYFGGSLGTFGTLYALAQIGVPAGPITRRASESLFSTGQIADGRFALSARWPQIWLCYTGMALQILWHFGWGDDPRTATARAILVQIINRQPERLTCPLSGGGCMSGETKALAGLLSIPVEQREAAVQEAIATLAERLLTQAVKLPKSSGPEAPQRQLNFPRYYNSDLSELVYLLARAGWQDHPRLREILRELLTWQTPQGRWRKARGTGGRLDVEPDYQPSRWLTWQVVAAVVLAYEPEDNPYART